MRVRYVPAFFLLACATALAAPPADSPFPTPPPPPLPSPSPQPAPAGTVLNLTPGTLYVVSWKVDSALRVHPAGLVTVTKKKGPITVYAKFAGGSGVDEEREFAGPCVYFLKPVAGASGRVELDLIPYGFKTDADIFSVAVDVNGGEGPRPPPKPDPKPDPKPEPVAFTWAVVVEESSARTPAIAAVLSDLPMWKRIEAKGVKWRIYDIDSPDAKAKNYDVLARPIGLPAVLCLDNAGKVAKSFKLPATGAELEALATGGSK